MDSIRNNYPALANFTYLNSCSTGLFSNTVLTFRKQLDESYQQKASNFRAGVYDTIKEIKATAADTFGATAERTSLIPSCSHGINMILDALANGQKVLHFKDDYPSIMWPFESRNFNCVTVENESFSEAELLQHIQEQQADILAVSVVQYSTGEVIAEQTFRAIKEAFPNLLIIVDATQFWGIAPFNFQESGIDLFAASSFKWLCAGYGNGAMFISEQLAGVLHSRTIGYNTYKKPVREGTPTLGAFFEPGHQDLFVFKTLQHQIQQHNEIGFDKIQAQIKKVKTYAREKIASETPFKVLTSINPKMEAGILAVEAPKALVRHLNQNQIICSYKVGLRLGIHFYNNFEDIDRLIEGMKSYS